MPGRPESLLKEYDYAVDGLRHQIYEGKSGLEGVPQGVKFIVATEAWRERIVMRTGERVTFESFEKFVATPPLEGLGSSIRQLRHLCRDDKPALDAIDRACQRPVGRPSETVDNINDKPDGTSAAAALRRLRKDRPDLHARVLAGKLSPHAAMLEAGFRRRTVTIPVQPDLAARRLWQRYGPEERDAFLAAFGPV